MSEAIKDVEQKLRAGIVRPLRPTTPAQGSPAGDNDNTDTTDDEPSSEDDTDSDVPSDSDSDSDPESDVEGDSGPDSELSDADTEDSDTEKSDRQPSTSSAAHDVGPGVPGMHAADAPARAARGAPGDSAGVARREYRDMGNNGVCVFFLWGEGSAGRTRISVS